MGEGQVGVVLGRIEIAGHEKNRRRTGKTQLQSDRMTQGFRAFDSLACESQRLGWITLQPKRPSQSDIRMIVGVVAKKERSTMGLGKYPHQGIELRARTCKVTRNL